MTKRISREALNLIKDLLENTKIPIRELARRHYNETNASYSVWIGIYLGTKHKKLKVKPIPRSRTIYDEEKIALARRIFIETESYAQVEKVTGIKSAYAKHIIRGTRRANSSGKITRRPRSGPKSPRSKYTNEQLWQTQFLLAKGINAHEIGRRLGVSYKWVYQVKYKRIRQTPLSG